MSKWLGFILILTFSFSVNNIFAQDAIVAGYTGPTTFDQYSEIRGTYLIKNAGIVDIANGVSCQAYLTPDSTFRGYDYWLGSYSTPKITPGETVEFAFEPYSFHYDTGTYFLVLVVDESNWVRETVEDNNVLVVPGIKVVASSVDWQKVLFEIPPVVSYTNNWVQHSIQIENAGSTNCSGSVYMSYFLSRDDSLDGDDLHLLYAGYSLGGSDDMANPVQFNGGVIPDTVSPGQYYLIVKLDPLNSFNETNEDNNVHVSGPFTIQKAQVDIHITSGTGYLDDFSWGYSAFDCQIHNSGIHPVSQYQIDAYVSEDSIFDATDTYLYNSNTFSETILPGDSLLVYGGGSSPVGYVSPGYYHLILVANRDTTITETDYSNNVFISPSPDLYIPEPPNPLIVIDTAAMDKPSYDYSEMLLGVDLTFYNQGDRMMDHISYEISIKDSTGNEVHWEYEHQSFSYMDSATYYSDSWTIQLPDPIAPGNYTLVITSWSQWSGTPYYEIPFTINSPFFQVTGTVVGEDTVDITKGKIFLYKKDDNGKVQFTFKSILENTNNFSFEVDHYKHTLYFIPDRIAFRSYVPTILGKKVTLDSTCFFTATHDIDTVFEILKVQPLPAGPMSISGSVFAQNNPPAGRPSGAQRISSLMAESVEGFPVVLLSDDDIPVMITTTDANGHYEFTGLPEDTYGLVVALELDQPVMEEPFPVDVTETNVVVDFDVSDLAVQPITMFGQEILFDEIPPHAYGDLPFDLAAVSSAGLTLTLTSSNPAVAIIENGKIVIVGVGETIIRAEQTGEGQYLAALPIERTLIVNKGAQIITMDYLSAKTFGDEAFEITATSSAGLPVVLTSSDETIAKIENGKVVIVGAGTVTITATQEGNDLYEPAEMVTSELTVTKASQEILAGEISEKIFGDDAFTLEAVSTSGLPVEFSSTNTAVATVDDNGTINIHGAGTASIWMKQPGNNNIAAAPFEKRILNVSKAKLALDVADIPEKTFGGPSFRIDISASVEGTLSVTSSDKTIASISDGNKVTIRQAGSVDITVKLTGGDNYEDSLVVKSLVIHKAEQGIDFEELGEVGPDHGGFQLNAAATSFLPVSYTSDNEAVATIDANNFVTINGLGIANITATQGGNENYLAAIPVSRALRVAEALGVEDRTTNLRAYPNPVTDVLRIETEVPLRNVTITDGVGKSHDNFSWKDTQIYMRELPAGIYIIALEDINGVSLLKVVKQ